MLTFPSSALRRRADAIQHAADAGPVVLEEDGAPRSVMMSIGEFARLKAKAGEGLPPGPGAVTRRGRPVDPLGYDTSDPQACALAMAEAALSGRNAAAVSAEIAAVERRLGRHP